MNPETLPSPTILRNKGVPVDVHRVVLVEERDEATGEVLRRWEPVLEGDEPVTEKRWVRVDANFLADVEEKFGNLGAFMEQILQRRQKRDDDGTPVVDEDGKPVFVTVSDAKTLVAHRRALSLLWGWEERRVGAAMIPNRMTEYGIAIQIAISIANGVDPTKAARMMEGMVRAARDQVQASMAAVDAALDELDDGTGESSTPGPSGSNSGGGTASGPETSSGPPALPRSSLNSTPTPTPTEPPDAGAETSAISSNGSAPLAPTTLLPTT